MISRKLTFWLITLTGFLILFSLGTWQVYRLQWKNNLIAVKQAALTADPISIEEAQKSDKEIEFNRVTAQGEWLPNTLYYIIGRTHNRQAGYHVAAPLIIGDKVIFVNLGWSAEKVNISLEGPAKVDGYVRYPYQNIFTPKPIFEKREWGAVLPDQMHSDIPAKYEIIDDIYLELKDPMDDPNLQALKPIPHTIDLPNRHLGYIITWYGLAIAWLFVMLRLKNKL